MEEDKAMMLHKTTDLEGNEHITGVFGFELALDCHGCDITRFTRPIIKEYLRDLCEAIEMVRDDYHFWDYEGIPKEEWPTEPHLLGISVTQFIMTSNVTVHTLALIERAYINVFSCKPFRDGLVLEVTQKWFKPMTIGTHRLVRK